MNVFTNYFHIIHMNKLKHIFEYKIWKSQDLCDKSIFAFTILFSFIEVSIIILFISYL